MLTPEEVENWNGPIILDCDGVLLDWLRPFRRFAEARIGRDLSPSPTSNDLHDWLDVDRAEAARLVREFNYSSAFGELEPMPGAVAAVEEMWKSRRSIVVLTSCGDSDTARIRRQRNLRRVFGHVFDEIVCLPLYANKTRHLQSIEKGIWVEDTYSAALAGAAAGHRSFMLRQPHNEQFVSGSSGEIQWADSWADLLPKLSLYG